MASHYTKARASVERPFESKPIAAINSTTSRSCVWWRGSRQCPWSAQIGHLQHQHAQNSNAYVSCCGVSAPSPVHTPRSLYRYTEQRPEQTQALNQDHPACRLSVPPVLQPLLLLAARRHVGQPSRQGLCAGQRGCVAAWAGRR